MNILIIANTSIDKPGNIGVRVAKIIKGLEKDGHNVFCYARGSKISNKKIFYFPFFEFIGRGLNFARLNIFDFSHRLIDSFIFEISTYLFLFFYDYSKTDIAICFEFMPNILKYLRKKNIYTITDIPITLENYKLSNLKLFSTNNLKYRKSIDKLEQKAIKNSDQIICTNQIIYNLIKKISPNTKTNICQYTSAPVKRINSILESKKFYLNNKKQVNYVFVGNLSSRKGIHPTIKAWIEFIDWTKTNFNEFSFNLKLLGKNNESINIPSGVNIDYLGFIDPKKIYSKSHYFLLASFQEGYPKALAEAKSYGCVPITTLLSEGKFEFNSTENISININATKKECILDALKESSEKINIWDEMSKKTYLSESQKPSYQEQICSIVKSYE